MQREFKFRAYESNKMWYQVRCGGMFDGIATSPTVWTGNNWVNLTGGEHTKVMQFTGLLDKNGKEIYEGDIVKYTFDLPESVYATENGLKIRIHPVFWSNWRSSFSVGNKLANIDLFNYVRNGNRVEVVGNIYENSDLLKEG